MAYMATDRRFYDGAPCADLQREIDEKNKEDALADKLAAAAGLRCTYFPGEWMYMVFNERYLPVDDIFYDTKLEAVLAAIKKEEVTL